ncbi:hypothetical protein PVAND_011749 [Polypedilum vanderplanki]|uniref:Uncharacterized protein n=1 Tax=Polypedilum vanderplanki TaxID=319348 RepID=A0A9J6CK92_POLVA|nr:hypothetical protein PVAND_011749 [Polypedilum vanderplanki]
MSYNSKTKFETKLRKLCSTFIITETADIETASDFIAAILQSDDHEIISLIIVQESINEKFKTLLCNKIKPSKEVEGVKMLSEKGFEVIGNRIVVCPHTMISNENSSVISYEVYRTIKEGIALAKNATSVSLWCTNISSAYEIIHSINATQFWLNSFGIINEKFPFLSNGKEIVWNGKKEEGTSALSEVIDSVFYQTLFQNEKFKTIVIPFGEIFAN